MTAIIELFIALVCAGGQCHTERIYISREAMAIASCESGDGWNYGTYSFTARSATNDGGMWQFNDATYEWLTGRANAERDHVATQHDTFVRLWNDGYGWRHWISSKQCWSRWLVIDEKGRAVWADQ